MTENKFVVRKGHFHIGDRNRFVVTGWFDGGNIKNTKKEVFTAYLDQQPLEIQTLVFSDDSVRQKYDKLDQKVEKEYVVIAKLPKGLSSGRRLRFYTNGCCIYERRVSQLLKMQKQLECRITDVQITGASLVLNGWAASEKPLQIRVWDQAEKSVNCEVSYFPRPDVALEYRESEHLSDCGFSIHVPMRGRQKMRLQITDGETSVNRTFSAIDKNRIFLYAKKAHYFMKRNGMKKTWKRAVNEVYELVGDTGNYMKWREKNRTPARELEKQRQEMRLQHRGRSLIYVVTAYEEAGHLNLTETAESLAHQTYNNWKWIIAVTASEKEKVKEQLKGHVPAGQVVPFVVQPSADQQHKIMYMLQKIREHIIKQETELSKSEQLQGSVPGHPVWVACLGQSDTLEPDAFYDCMELAEAEPEMNMLYTDEDQISADSKEYGNPLFKSDFNIDMLRAMNYLGNMVLLREDLFRVLAPWNPGYAADAGYDYYLRAAESAGNIGHLRRAVYHAREYGQSGRDGKKLRTVSENGPQPGTSGKMVLDAHYKRMELPAVVEESELPGIYHTFYHWKETPMVSINIPNMDHIDDLDTCVQSVLKNCTYPDYEIVIIENNSKQQSTFDYYHAIQQQDSRVRVIYWQDRFNFAEITNFGVAHSKGEYILLMNNDTEVITPGFMEEMLGYCMRSDVGICGARLFYFDDTIQHAGVIVGLGGICGEGFQKFPKENPGYQSRICCPQDYSAVTAACMMTPKKVFEEVGGMDREFQVAYNDIDYCLKVRGTGRLVVYNPFAMLYHYEYKSRGTENTAEKLARYNREVDLFTSRWADLISSGDPYYNPNLTKRYQDFSLRRIELLQ